MGRIEKISREIGTIRSGRDRIFLIFLSRQDSDFITSTLLEIVSFLNFQPKRSPPRKSPKQILLTFFEEPGNSVKSSQLASGATWIYSSQRHGWWQGLVYFFATISVIFHVVLLYGIGDFAGNIVFSESAIKSKTVSAFALSASILPSFIIEPDLFQPRLQRPYLCL